MRPLLLLLLPAFALAADPPGVTVNKARIDRIKKATIPKLSKPVPFDSPEADAILAALEILPPDNPWNIPVADWPVHPRSKEIVGTVGKDKPLRYNPDMNFVLVPPGQKAVEVDIVENKEESDKGPFPVPADTPIEGWPANFKRDDSLKKLTLADVQRGKPDLEADRHAVVVDPTARKLYEFYRLTRTAKGWTADGAATFDLSSNTLRPDGWTSSDAAGLPLFPAVVRYDELKRGVIDHALRVTVKKSQRAYVYPATHFASSLKDKDLPRMGERFRLKKDFDTSAVKGEAKIILEALQTYGMIVADNGIEWAVSVTPDERIPDLHDALRKVKGGDFEVVTPPDGYEPAK